LHPSQRYGESDARFKKLEETYKELKDKVDKAQNVGTLHGGEEF
jgi:uncharacterized protein YdcH (DUF465 family)